MAYKFVKSKENPTLKGMEDKLSEMGDRIGELAAISHPPVEFASKLHNLHNKIDSIYSILETLSDRLNELEYSGTISFGDTYEVGRDSKKVSLQLTRAFSSPNPHGDDDYATPIEE
jgi:hypothetical protein